MKIKPKLFNVVYEAFFYNPNKHQIKIWCARPSNFGCQKIKKFSLVPKETKKYIDKNKNIVLYINTNNKKGRVQLKIIVKLWQQKETFKLKPLYKNNSYKTTGCLSQEKFLEQTTSIRKITNRLILNKTNNIDKIISITNFLRKNFIYKYPVKQRGVKYQNTKKLTGDCGEAGALFVTMCRIAGIPARNHTGYIIYHDKLKSIYEHGWTSVCVDRNKWIDIDPMAKNISKKKNGHYIYKQNNYLFTLSRGFNIKIKPKIPSNHSLRYWQKQGLPISRSCVQILQPLIFTSIGKIGFKDSIKVKRP